jgi:hypothetical protein
LRNAYNIFVGKPEGKRPFGRCRQRDAKIIGLAQDRGWFYEHSNEPSGSIKCGEFLDLLSDSWLFRKKYAAWIYFVS